MTKREFTGCLEVEEGAKEFWGDVTLLNLNCSGGYTSVYTHQVHKQGEFYCI